MYHSTALNYFCRTLVWHYYWIRLCKRKSILEGRLIQLIAACGKSAIGFLDLDAKWSARLIGLFVNCWISVPSIMLLATGNLSNRDVSLYEAAKIDGAGRWKQFEKLTMPFMLFSTMPVLLGQFIGNFNNFGIFYFLRGGHISMSKKWKFGRMMDTGITYLILTAVAFVFFSRVSG